MMQNTVPELQVLHVTARLAVLQLPETEADYSTEEYDIYVDGEKRLTTTRTVESLFGLKPDTEYTVRDVRGECDRPRTGDHRRVRQL